MNKKGGWAVIVIFMLVIIILLLGTFFGFTRGFFESGLEYTAVSAIHDAIDEVCDYENNGVSLEFGPQYVPYQSSSARKQFYYKIEEHSDVPYVVLKYKRDIWVATQRETLKKIPLENCGKNIDVVNSTGEKDFDISPADSNSELLTIKMTKDTVNNLVQIEMISQDEVTN